MYVSETAVRISFDGCSSCNYVPVYSKPMYLVNSASGLLFHVVYFRYGKASTLGYSRNLSRSIPSMEYQYTSVY